jgi:hypothetical protein
MEDTQQKLSDLDIFFENVLVDFQEHLGRIEEIKLNLLEIWKELKEVRIPQQIIENSDNYNKQNDLNEITAELNAINIEKNSYIGESCARDKFDVSNLTDNRNFNRDKSFMGKIYRDTSINFANANVVEQNNANLKRKSKID